MADFIAGRYQITKLLGRGGMANVYLAFDNVLKREVAVKILKADMASDPVSLERFSREANASSKISHPNIVDIYDVGEDNNQHYIVMEYVKGYTLKELLKRRGALQAREAVWLIKQLASALMEAHKNGLIHRDIKSQNVLIKDDGTIKLADFGIAVLNNAMQLTSKDSVLGSVHYLAPELAKGGSATMKSDIYSLGIVFYELLTGDVPFKADTPVQVALMHINKSLPDVKKFNPQIPQSVINILLKATAKNLNERYDNVALMLKDLNNCFNTNNKKKNPVNKNYNISSSAKETISLNKKAKSEKRLSVLIIVSISLLSIFALIFILFITGVFNGTSLHLVEVPDVIGLNQASALDVIDSKGLKVNYPIERKLTADIEEGKVINVSPNAGSKVEKGYKLDVTVSSGIYAVMPNYVGKNINEVINELNNLFIVSKKTVLSDEKEPGTIVNQIGLLEGETYDPNTKPSVTFEIAYPESVNIPTQLLGRSVNDVVDLLEDEGFNVEVHVIAKDELSDDELNKYDANKVCRTDPVEGSLFTKSDDSYIKIYYYENEVENKEE